MAGKSICANCGTICNPKNAIKGSFIMEIVLWIFFIIPGLIYSLWRLTTKYKACPECGSKEIVPIKSPRGEELASKYQKQTQNDDPGLAALLGKLQSDKNK